MDYSNDPPVARGRTISLWVLAIALGLGSCTTRPSVALLDPTVVEAACGECKFGMRGKSCDIAVRVGGRSYFVDGVKADALGDAHAADGICESIRKARVTGTVTGNRFVATGFELLPTAAK